MKKITPIFSNPSSLMSLLFLCIFSLIGNTAFGQTFKGKLIQEKDPVLDAMFSKYDVYEINSNSLKDFVNNPNYDNNVSLELATDYAWDLYLHPKDIRTDDYFAQTETGEIIPKGPNTTYAGHEKTMGGVVRLTISDNFILGFLQQGSEMIFIEPVTLHAQDSNANHFVVYNEKDVIPGAPSMCGVNETFKQVNGVNDRIDTHTEEKSGTGCWEIEDAIATDLSMFQWNGSAQGLIDFTTALMNNVDGLYDCAFFDYEIAFSIPTHFIVTTADPPSWTSTNDGGELYFDFADWGAANGFGIGNNGFDLGTLWTDRDFSYQGSSGVVGLALLGVLCDNSGKYQLNERYTTNTSCLNVLWAHEIGHNLGSDHDNSGSNTIMAPSVTKTSNWSNMSINTIEAEINSNQGCLINCTGGPTCSDGIQNQGETGVDCGGPCTACPPTCSDGIQNGTETGVDCGGSCPDCPATCYNNLTNANGLGTNENGVADYESSTFISNTANVTIRSGASVDYDATTYVQLNPNFTVNGGATFNAFINGCNNGNGGVNLTGGDDNTTLLNQTDTDNTPADDVEVELEIEENLGKKYIKELKDNAIKQIEGMR